MTLLLGDCRDKLKEISSNSVDIIYLDPPFYTQKIHVLKNRNSSKKYSFNDIWENLEDYLAFIKQVLFQLRRVLKETGSIFLHCDRYACHHLRILLDEAFGIDNFQSEIIWSYKRWSNSKKGLLNSHQNILFYSKTKNFKFNGIYTEYSPTTNVDQILQERERDSDGKSIYRKDRIGNAVLRNKNGVPLSDVWEIPLLNPKAKERYGYPTQKPVMLLEQIIKISSDKNDVILDPFCGSGTTLVAAKMNNRKFIGIDISKDAICLSKRRLNELIKTESALLEKGVYSYINKTEKELSILKIMDAIPVQRNAGVDGFLKKQYGDKPIPIKIQKNTETLSEAKVKLLKVCKNKKFNCCILVKTNNFESPFLFEQEEKCHILVVDSYELTIRNWFKPNIKKHNVIEQLEVM
jgi:site-specific DNA-methyltransferase (adenine-specific)